ncbi:MAG: MBL fold metallo-hydrolase [Acidimicrobiales bacterium]
MGLGTRPFEHGIVEAGDGNWAWLQPDGGWGWSNAGLIVDGDEALLVDTLFDLTLTRQMLDGFAAASPEATIRALVNTHSNGDHCNGNELVAAEIITSRRAAAEMALERPETLAALLAAADSMGVTGEFFRHCFGAFDLAGIDRPLPTTDFDGTAQRTVGGTIVDLVEVGPAHTAGDVLVHVPSRSTVFTGDILFVEGHPILWAGTIPDVLAALDLIASWQPEVIVPGHGPIHGSSRTGRDPATSSTAIENAVDSTGGCHPPRPPATWPSIGGPTGESPSGSSRSSTRATASSARRSARHRGRALRRHGRAVGQPAAMT